MSNFLYNGVELPGLPETWNEATHPHLFIRVVSLDGSAENAVYSLFAASAAAVSYDDNGILFPSSAVGEKYAVSDGAWVESSESLSDAFYIKRNDGFLYTLWANFDILNLDGSVYIAASEPVPVVEKFPIREWIGWLLAGLCSRPLPMGAREPVAYLYNGVRLPGLPKEWNPVTHPFACIRQTASLNGYWLFLLKEIQYTVSEKGNWCFVINPGNSFQYRYRESFAEFAWEQMEGYDTDMVIGSWEYWANFDLLNEDGSVYVSASDPIPVYE